MPKDESVTANCVSCKIGTIPMLVIIDRRRPIKIGRKIRWRERGHGTKWQEARVTKINNNGYFFADRV